MAVGWRASYLRYREFFLNVYALYKSRNDIKIFLEIILSASAISFFSIFAIRPTLLTVSGLATQIKSKEETLSTMNKKIQNLQTAQNVFSKETRIPLVKTAVPDEPGVEAFVGQVQGLAGAYPVKIQGVSISEVALVGGGSQKPKDEQLASLPEGSGGLTFSISATGEYSNLLDFTSNLEKLRRPVKIDSLTISSSKVESGKNLVLVINGRTPYIKLK